MNLYIYIAYIKGCSLEKKLLVHIWVKNSSNIINYLNLKQNRPFRLNSVLNSLPYAYITWQPVWDHITNNT